MQQAHSPVQQAGMGVWARLVSSRDSLKTVVSLSWS